MASQPTHNDSAVNRMWGGRFTEPPTDVMTQITSSLHVDKRLALQDILGSKVHAQMLTRQGIITQEDADTLISGLDRIALEIEAGTFQFPAVLEDIHMAIETRLSHLVGAVSGRLHTARSRNDQVATDLRLWIRAAIDQLDHTLAVLQKVLLTKAEPFTEAIMPGLTHLQPAQPITFAFHLLAYVEMIGRDRGRFADGRRRLNECPLGAAALAGTAFPIDRAYTATSLGFDRPTANALDSVSDRDFAVDFLTTAAMCGVHLSRLAEEIVLWCSSGFDFIRLSDAFTSGSSIMPQKRNPDAAELVRAKTARLIGNVTSLFIVLKALPLAYAKDLQEDKHLVFDANDTLSIMIAATIGMIQDLQPHPEAMRHAAQHGHSTATDVADWLVRVANVPFRDAHRITGQLVRIAEERKIALSMLELDTMQNIDRRITTEIYSVLSVDASVTSRTSEGGTSPIRVREAIAAARERFQL